MTATLRMISFLLVLAPISLVCLPAQTLTTIVSLSPGTPEPTSLVQGADGNFYGTTGNAIASTGGTIFQLTPSGVLTTLYTFPDIGSAPTLMQASDGNFYGTDETGGTCVSNLFQQGCGFIFKFTPPGTVTTLHNFQVADGAYPVSRLIQGSDGNLYGATSEGGAFAGGTEGGYGTLFRLTLSGNFTMLYSFSGTDGVEPSGLVQASDGNFYGVTDSGGPTTCPNFIFQGCGTAFKLTPSGAVSTLYNFSGGNDGSQPQAPLALGADANLYGTTTVAGTLFRLTTSGSFTTLYTFIPFFDAAFPTSPLISGPDGKLYGFTPEGGPNGVRNIPCGNSNGEGCGVIFDSTLSGTYANLYNFCSQPNCADGTQPVAMVLGKDGNLYGLTSNGGANGAGTFFRFSVASSNAPSTSGVLNGASFQPGISPGAWITISGTNLSAKTDTWSNSIVKGALPTTLDGVSVMIGGQPAYVEYVSPTQINALAPSVPAGSVAVTVTNANGTSQTTTAQLSAETPAFFQWGTYAVATHQDYTYAVKNGTFAGTTTVPAKPGDVIILWGTGFGPTSPGAPAGMQTPATATYNTASAVSVTVDGKSATVYGAALASGYAGLYQIAIQIPAGLANGDYPVVATINGASSPSTTVITVQQ